MREKYTLILGTKDWSSWSLRPYLAMQATGAAFDEIVVPLRRAGGATREQILKYSPAGRLPVLQIDDAGERQIVWDSLAICETLAERHPDAKLWPDSSEVRAQARAYAAEMHSGFAELRAELSMDFARRLPQPALSQEAKEQVARVVDSWSAALARYGADGGFLFGRFSIADCMYAPVVSRFITYGIALPEPIKAYTDRMFALPAMQDWGKAAKAEVDSGLA